MAKVDVTSCFMYVIHHKHNPSIYVQLLYAGPGRVAKSLRLPPALPGRTQGVQENLRQQLISILEALDMEVLILPSCFTFSTNHPSRR